MINKMLALVRPQLLEMAAYEVPKFPGIEVKLDANESPYGLPEAQRIALGKALAQIDLNRYPDPNQSRLRELIAAQYGVAQNTLLFGNGSDEIISILIACLAQPRPGQSVAKILFPSPTFSVFHLLAMALGVESCSAPLAEDFSLDLVALRKALEEHAPNIVFFARPNNPTGTLWRGEDVLRLARDYPDVLFVSDEAYGEYSSDSLVHALPQYPNLLIMKTLSKLGLAGLRIGFAMADASLIAQLNKARAPYNVSTVNQHAACWVLENSSEFLREQCKRVVQERSRVAQALGERAELRVYDSAANLILFRVGTAGQGKGRKCWEFLQRKGVLVRNFEGPGPLADCLRVTIGTPEENDRFLASLPSSF